MDKTIVQRISYSPTILQQPSWYRGLTLSERLASLPSGMGRSVQSIPHDAELAARRLNKWKTQAPFEKDVPFLERLALDGVTEEELAILLCEPAEALQVRTPTPPEWLSALQQAFEESGGGAEIDIAGTAQQPPHIAFLKPLIPLLRQAMKRLADGIAGYVQQYGPLPFLTQASAVFLPNLCNQLLPVVSRTFTLELHVARLEERLQGETSEERFQSFIAQLCEPGAMLTLLCDYPVLARALTLIQQQWVEYALEFLGHLCADWDEICATLLPEAAPGALVEAAFGAGDTHRHGRSVIQLTFSSGFKLLYKPKSLTIDTHFQTLLTWLNERGEHPPFRTIKIIDKGSYGWSEFVPAQPCHSMEEVRRFYERQGAYLALLYVFQATDFHHENLIASGEHPVLIDLESLFQPDVHFASDDAAPQPPGVDMLRNSVLRPGLLPMRIWSTEDGEGVDISGLGGKGGQLTPGLMAMLDAVGTDQMRVIRQRASMESKQNRPTLDGAEVGILEFAGQVIAGFTKMYRLLRDYREELLADVLPGFADDEIRVITRATRTYMQLLQEGRHPTLLHNALDLDRFFDRLWVTVPQQPHFARLIAAEQEDLRRQDIPFFTTRLNSRHLYSSSGQAITDFLKELPLEAVKRRLRGLDDENLVRQCWIIQASFATVTSGLGQATWKESQIELSQIKEQERLPRKVLRERLMQASCDVGERLAELAIHGKKEVSWLGLHYVREREWSIAPLGWDLYSGMAGVCLFLAYLGAVTGQGHYSTLARQALETIQQQVEKTKGILKAPGAFNGWGGLIYLYTHLGVLWQERSWLTEAEDLLASVSPFIEEDTVLDVIGGTAGGLLSLLNLYHVAPSAPTLEATTRCGEHLLARAHPVQQGVGWLTPFNKEHPLVGLSHGAAGIALSLLELAAVSGEERFKDTALAAMAYERSVFAPERQNWPDLRDLEREGLAEAQDRYGMVTWCHGAPGIGLARLASLKHLDDTGVREEITVALNTTHARGFGLNHSLCHGDLGNLETLLTARQILADSQASEDVERLAVGILESIARHGWCTGVPLGIETPGLMTGIAGIGYGLLRLAEPERVPSVLLLAPPCQGELLRDEEQKL